MPWRNKILTRLFPIAGLSIEPSQPEGPLMVEGVTSPVLAFLVAKGSNGTVFVEASDDGSLKTAQTGSGLETYEVFSGTATDVATALGVAAQSARADFFITAFGLTISFQKSDGSWLTDIELPVGNASIDFSYQDIRIDNTVGGGAADAIYQIIVWS